VSFIQSSEENEGKKSPILWFRGTPGTPNNINKTNYQCGPSITYVQTGQEQETTATTKAHITSNFEIPVYSTRCKETKKIKKMNFINTVLLNRDQPSNDPAPKHSEPKN